MDNLFKSSRKLLYFGSMLEMVILLLREILMLIYDLEIKSEIHSIVDAKLYDYYSQ